MPVLRLRAFTIVGVTFVDVWSDTVTTIAAIDPVIEQHRTGERAHPDRIGGPIGVYCNVYGFYLQGTGTHIKDGGNELTTIVGEDVTNKVRTSNVVTLTTSLAHGPTVGDVVNVYLGDPNFNGTFTVTAVPTTTTFSYASTGSNIASQAAIGIVTTSTIYAAAQSDKVRARFDSYLSSIKGVRVPAGSSSTPGLAFIQDTDTGFVWQTSGDFAVISNGNTLCRFQPTQFLLTDSWNIGFGSSTGTKIGTSATQKLAFWNATPVVRPTGWARPRVRYLDHLRHHDGHNGPAR